jgi:hypothetical protein
MGKHERFIHLVDLCCVACRKDGICDSPSEIHHLKGYKFSGMGMKATSDDTIPLCYQHHRGQFGYHTSPKAFTEKYGTQQELLDYTNQLLIERGYNVRN